MRCPSCGSSYFSPSRPRDVLERLRLWLSNRVLYRCQKCEHRQWLDEDAPADEPGDSTVEDEHQAQWEYFSSSDEADTEKPGS
jgi:DNA-directed RNA polymerase subunit RPC12/RpoP